MCAMKEVFASRLKCDQYIQNVVVEWGGMYMCVIKEVFVSRLNCEQYIQM